MAIASLDAALAHDRDHAGNHTVQFYESEPFLFEAVTQFVVPALDAGGSAVLIALPAHLDGITRRLGVAGVDPGDLVAQGRLIVHDAAELLTRFMIGNLPDRERFRQEIGAVLERAAAAGQPVHAYGEMVAVLVAEGNAAAAIELEALWNDLQQEMDFHLLCAYPLRQDGDAHASDWLPHVCAAHGEVVPAESYSALYRDVDRMHTIVALQQKALRLQTEIAGRLAAEERLIAAEAAEQLAVLEVEALKARHDNLLADAAHELRNPLTSLSLNAQLTLRQLERSGNIDPHRVEKALRAIATQAATMCILLDRLQQDGFSSSLNGATSPPFAHPPSSMPQPPSRNQSP